MSRVLSTPADGDRLVNRLKNTNLDKFQTLCKMHLSFLLHLPGSSLEEILGGSTATPATPGHITMEKNKSHFLHFSKRRCHKESRCTSPCGIEQSTLDQFLPLVDYLSCKHSLCQEGLFRKSGHIGRQKLLREKLQAGDDVHLELEQGVYSAHDCANVLKSCLSDLAEPLLTDRLYLAHCQVSEMEQETKQLQTIQLLIQLVPAQNLYLLRRLLSLLHKASAEPSNKMTSETLGTLFAPHLFVPRKTSGSELHAVAGDLTKTAAFMIDNAANLFKVPPMLLADIATYWAQMEQSSDTENDLTPDTPETPRLRYHKRVDTTDAPINTTVTFTDRQASLQAAEHTDTQVALAELYAHISSMPESTKKRKYLQKFHKANCTSHGSPLNASNRHKRTKSFGDSIKKLVHRNQRRQGSGHMIQFALDDSRCSAKDTPVVLKARKPITDRPSHVVKLFSQVQDTTISNKSPSHITDTKENAAPTFTSPAAKRKASFCDSPVPSVPVGSAVFLSPIATFPSLEDSVTETTPFVHSKKRIM